ncbi:uncharacterized protein MELLADRAFT_65379 [Melampsora larici-populina 98AG31]|uniref:Uncharacterized protein n=1 Tax=Melampsora larici-populina (strain 98AG31 / pathotype 3-4-7) TaxID=747676 RepID=F4RV45_MELLP|nr:uncharacterized protein MELLADRAFT_65379 [Melampsora larici-populina 98AG31]EGG03809.1 hypothetical protein MELLADRAFT_65379 [Melampsora larici-populina 98AG31]
MKKLDWYFLIQHSFIFLQLNAHEYQNLNLEIETKEVLNISRTKGEINHEELDRDEVRCKDKIEQNVEPTESELSTEDQINTFWNSSNGIIKFKKTYLESNHPRLVDQINELIQSNLQTWYKKINEIFQKIELRNHNKRDIYEEIGLFQIFHHLSNQFELPLKLINSIWIELLKMRDMGKTYTYKTSNKIWWIEVDIVIRFYESKMMENISLLESGSESYNDIKLEIYRSLTAFVIMQEELDEYGVKLMGHWSPEDQKELFKLWISDGMRLYSKLKWNPRLQNLIETQIVQTNLINSFQILKLNQRAISLQETRSILITQSRTVLEYIKSLRHGITMKDFISWQILIQPYGLKVSESLDLKNQITIIKFWSTCKDF